ncbi:MAG: universal stress protein [Caulobacter sp.]|nr:universal stress protein [Vitreoscilla sp.]
MYRNILIPTDGTDITAKAVATGVALAKALGARLSTITVKEPFPYSAISEMQPIPPQEFYDAQERIALSRVKEVVASAGREGVDCQAFTAEAQHPWEAIVDHAKTHSCDLIVMASHGRRGMSALLLGSETTRVLVHCPVPVLVVK